MESTEDIASLLLALHDSTPRTHLPTAGQPRACTSQLPSLPVQPNQSLPRPEVFAPEQVKLEPQFQSQPYPTASKSSGHQLSSSLGPASSPGGHLQNNVNRDPTGVNSSFHIRVKSPSTILQNLPPPPVIHPVISSPPTTSTFTSLTIPPPDTQLKTTVPLKTLSPSAPSGPTSSSTTTTPTVRGTKRKRGTGSKADLKAKSKSALTSAEALKVNIQSPAHVLHPDAGIIRCICGIIDDDGFTIQCDHCYAWEHAVCMGIQEGNVPDEYLCELCSPRIIDFHGAKEKQRAKKEELTLRAEIEAARANTHQRKNSGPIGSTSTVGEKGSSHGSHSKNKKSNHLIREVLHPPSKDSQPLSIDTCSLPNPASAIDGQPILSTRTLPESQIPTFSQTSSTNQTSSNLHFSLSSIQQPSLVTTNPPSPHPGSTNSAIVTQDEDEKFEPWTMEYFPVRENVVRDPVVRQKLQSLQTVWDQRLGGLVGSSSLSSMTKIEPEVDSSKEEESPTRDQIKSHEEDEDMKDRSSPAAPTPSTIDQKTKSPIPVPIKVPPEYEPSFSTLGDFLPPVLLAAPTLASVSSKLQIKPLPANAPSNPPQQSFTLSHPSITTSLLRPVYTRPNAYAVFAEGAVPQGTLVGELNGELVQGFKYRQDPINQYWFLGCPKPGVRTLGPGIDLVLDSRGFGNQLRFIRSSCHPNCVLRPMLFFRDPSLSTQDTPFPPADLSPSDSNSRSTPSGSTGELLFGVFATKDISKREEITLPWEWDDDHVVHALQKLLDSKFSGPFHHSLFNPSSVTSTPIAAPNLQMPAPTSGTRQNSHYPVDDVPSLAELVPKLSTVLIHLTGTFATCACLKKKDCVLSQMARLVEGKPFWGLVEKTVGQGRGGRRPKRPDLGPLIGPVRGWRNREMERWTERKRLIDAHTLVRTRTPEDIEGVGIVGSPNQPDQVPGEVADDMKSDDEQETKETDVHNGTEVEKEIAAEVQSEQTLPLLKCDSSPVKPGSKISVKSFQEEENMMDVDQSIDQRPAPESRFGSPPSTASASSKFVSKNIGSSPVDRSPSPSINCSDVTQSKNSPLKTSQQPSSPSKDYRSIPASSPMAVESRELASDIEPTADEDPGNFSDASTLTEPLSNYDSDSASDDAETFSSPSSIAESDSEEDDMNEDEEAEEETQGGNPRSGLVNTPKAVIYSSDELSSPGPPSSPTSSHSASLPPMTPLKSAPVGRKRFPTRVESESPPSSPPGAIKTFVEEKASNEQGSVDAVAAQSKKERGEDDPMSPHLPPSSATLQPTTTTTTDMPFPPSPPPAHLDPWMSLSLSDDVKKSVQKTIPTGPRLLTDQSGPSSTEESTPFLAPPSPSPPPKEPTPPPPKPPTPPPVKRMSLKDWSKRKKAAAPLPAVEKMMDVDESNHSLYQSEHPPFSSPKKTGDSTSVLQIPVSRSFNDTPDDLIYPPSSPNDEIAVATNARVGAVKDASRPPTPLSEDEPIPGFTPRQSRVQQSNLSSTTVASAKASPPSPFLATSSTETKAQNQPIETPSTVYPDPPASQKTDIPFTLPDAWRHRNQESVDTDFAETRSITPPPFMFLSSSPRTLQTRRSSTIQMSDPSARSPSPIDATSPSTTPPLPHRQLSSSVKSNDPPKGPASVSSRVTGVLPVRRLESSIPTGPHKSLPPLPPSLPAKPIAVRPTHSPTRSRFGVIDREESLHNIERDREVEERERERERERDRDRERESERDILREQRSSVPLKDSPVSSTAPQIRPPFHSPHVRPFGPGAFRGRGALAGVPSGPRTTWTPPRGPRGMSGPFRGGGMGGRGISNMPTSGMAPRAPRMMVPAGEERERIDNRLPPPTRLEGRDVLESPRGAFRGRGGLFRGRAR